MIKTALRLVGYMAKKWITGRGRGVILCYHRVLPSQQIQGYGPNTGLIVSSEQFEAQMRYLAEHCKPVSLDEMLNASPPARSERRVAVTFDDGTADNLIYALPILEKYQIPATIYVTTGFVLGEHFPWWAVLWNHLKTAQEFRLPGDGRGWKLQDDAGRIQCFKAVHRQMMRGGLEGYEAIYAYLKSIAQPLSEQDRYLTPEEVGQLAAHPLITIGAHTHSHRPFVSMSRSEVEREVSKAQKLLEQWIGRGIVHFAYPYGFVDHEGAYQTKGDDEYPVFSAVTTVTGNVPLGESFNKYTIPRLSISKMVPFLLFRALIRA